MINMRKRKELVSDISKGENSSTISSQIIISDRLNYRPADPTNRTDRNRYILLEEREILFANRFSLCPNISNPRQTNLRSCLLSISRGRHASKSMRSQRSRMHKNSPGIRRVACRDDGIPIRRLRPHTYTHTHVHREIQSAG